MGSVPDDVPKVPLLVDVEKIQKRLRVPFTAEIKELILDLRKPNDLERSIFFHRLQLLGIDWTILGRIDGKGTFKEKWTLYHKPEQIIQIIERAIWGNTVMEATQKYLLKQMGIECIYVVGTVKEQGAHAWNIVKCDDKYYQMDVTFGDPIFQENETGETLPHDLVNYEYLCCTDEEIFTDHQQDDFVPYPVCDSNDLEYYRINGLYYETFDENEIYEKMKAGIEQGQEMFAIRFSENAVYEVAKEKIIDNLIPQAAQFLVDFRQLEEVKYTYAVDDRKRIIMIFWYS